ANVSLKVKQLPNAPQVTFKVVQSYSDGEVVRWIELAGPDGKEPDNPAPIVKLTPGAASAISPKPANDNDADSAAAKDGSLARTGAADRPLAARLALQVVPAVAALVATSAGAAGALLTRSGTTAVTVAAVAGALAAEEMDLHAFTLHSVPGVLAGLAVHLPGFVFLAGGLAWRAKLPDEG